MDDRNIRTYFSHSYRREDQDLNMRFWRLFEAEGFFFSVDPPSSSTTNTHLERMMDQSNCYVAIVNRRNDLSDLPNCSRFIMYELSLALQARRPRLLLVDRRVQGGPWSGLGDQEVQVFDPAHPEDIEASLRNRIVALRKRALPAGSSSTKARGPIGLLLPRDRPDQCYGGVTTQEQIEQAAARHGFPLKRIIVPQASNTDLALVLDRCEAVILGVRADKLPDWVFAYVHGRLIPSLKLVRVGKHEVPHRIKLPPLVQGLQMDKTEPAVESLIYWRSRGDLVYQLSQSFEKLDEDSTELRGEPGVRYFRSIGRRPARVFISNSNAANDLAGKLSDELRLDNIERFQYKDEGAIATGSGWPEKIKHELEICQIFVALVGRGYKESEWCMKEYRTAKRRTRGDLKILPYQVDDSDVGFVGNLQVTDLRNRDTQHTPILEDIHRYLTEEDKEDWTASHAMLLGGSKEVVTDALRQLPRDAWQQLAIELGAAGITVNTTPFEGKAGSRRSRQVADQLLAEVQRSAPIPSAKSPLALLVDLLKEAAPPPYFDALGGVHARLADAE